MRFSRSALLHISSSTAALAFTPNLPHPHLPTRNLHIHGRTDLPGIPKLSSALHTPPAERPPDPSSFLSPSQQEENVAKLVDWFEGKRNVLCITGAGLSTESGIPDYRGYNGSYRVGHKPMLHDQFMRSERSRRRYWARSMVGWRKFSESRPNAGHYALFELEQMGRIGVQFADRPEFYSTNNNNNNNRKLPKLESASLRINNRNMSIITQNVDTLHQQAGSKHVCELHGQTKRLKCMNCGAFHSRDEFHTELERLNRDWIRQTIPTTNSPDSMRPDGDAAIPEQSYDDVAIPPCSICQTGFLKPDVVFFGDCVPKHRVDRCYAAVDAADGLLCIGSSLAVHSSFRFVQAAAERGVEIAILNVGTTRAETSRLEVLKVESPIGATLEKCVEIMGGEEREEVVDEAAAIS